jgi:hypothetical protein
MKAAVSRRQMLASPVLPQLAHHHQRHERTCEMEQVQQQTRPFTRATGSRSANERTVNQPLRDGQCRLLG